MKIKSIKKIIAEKPSQYYDIINAAPYHNFLIKTASGFICSHNCNFSLVNNPEKAKGRMMKMITQIDARMKSRFMRGTYLPTLNIIASSKDSEQSFLEAYIANKLEHESKNTLIVDEPQWVVDSRKDSPQKFYVGIGNKFLANELLPLDASPDLLDEYRAKGYQLWQVPMGYLDTFQLNLDEAICSIIGIATASSLKYISGIKLNETKVDTYKNPFVRDVIEVGNAPTDQLQYANFFDLSRVSPEDISKPLFIHLDMSLSGDKTGIAGVWITGKSAQKVISGPETEQNSETQIDRDLYFKVAFSVSIKAPKGTQVSFAKNRNFIRWLRDQGFAIKGISSDTFQSANIQQDLAGDGFNMKVVTVDRVQKTQAGQALCLPYHYLKAAIYERRLKIYKDCPLLTDELVGLERKADGHIDHTKEGINCLTGDTKISLVDGRELSILELVKEFNLGNQNYVYTVNEDTLKIEPKLIINAFKSGRANKLIKLTLDNGEVIKCTPEHRFMLRNGKYCEAQNLLVNDSLMPLYRKYPDEVVAMRDYRMYYEPIEDAWHYEHRQFATEVLDEKYLVHHKNCTKKDNSPSNLIWCSKQMHQQLHALLQTGAQSKEANEKRIRSLKQWHAENKNTIEYILSHNHNLTFEEIGQYFEKKQKNLKRIGSIEKMFNVNYADLSKSDKIKYSTQYSNLLKGKHVGTRQESNAKHELIRKQIIEIFNVNYDQLSKDERQSYAVKLARLNDPNYQEKVSVAVSTKHKLGKYKKAEAALKASNEFNKQVKLLFPTVDKDKFIELFGFDYYSLDTSTKAGVAKKAVWINRYRKQMYDLLNHSVAKIETVWENTDVYDLTIQDNPNFALSAGIFVHNSKDQADAVCGATWLASQFSDEYSYSYGESLDVSLDVNESSDTQNTKQKMIADFERELTSIWSEIRNAEDLDYRQKQAEYQSYQDISGGIIII